MRESCRPSRGGRESRLDGFTFLVQSGAPLGFADAFGEAALQFFQLIGLFIMVALAAGLFSRVFHVIHEITSFYRG
ncbi:hypothetical protein SPHFLASMR4Y_01986 [Sphingorhabdus sp. SMR4y]|nr:hypothetical protein SPHFLASMR4Y_01986 [Sphingorhabdus sp. SMR4y]